MGTDLPLKERMGEFLLVYRATLHATPERRPDEQFLHRRLRTFLVDLS